MEGIKEFKVGTKYQLFDQTGSAKFTGIVVKRTPKTVTLELSDQGKIWCFRNATFNLDEVPAITLRVNAKDTREHGEEVLRGKAGDWERRVYSMAETDEL